MANKYTKKCLISLAFVGVGLFFFYIGAERGFSPSAHAMTPAISIDNLIVMPVQIERDSYGIAMVDTIAQNIWIYEIKSRGVTHNRLKLLAARNFRYDSMLQQYNTAEPKPEQVKAMLETLDMYLDGDKTADTNEVDKNKN